MKRGPFYIDLKKQAPAVVTGYTTDLLIDYDSTRLAVGVHRSNAGYWKCSELSTGLLIASARTRREAIELSLTKLALAFPSQDGTTPVNTEAMRAEFRNRSGREESLNLKLSAFAFS